MPFISKIFAASACFLCAAISNAALAGSLSLGAAVSAGTSEYRDTDPRALPVPLINYESERFYVRGLSAGIPLWSDGMSELSVALSYLPQHFDASRSDDWRMKRLSNRHSTAMAGVNYRLTTEWGIGRIGLAGDILDNSNGFLADAAYMYPFVEGPLTITPGVGVQWTSSNHNDYYYGVGSTESRKSGLKSYEADDGFSPYVEVSTRYNLNANLNIFLNGRVLFLSEEIKDSPMVDKDAKADVTLGFSYRF